MEKEKKQTKEVEIKVKSPMWLVVLVAILVIALGCEFVYIYNLKHMQQVKQITENETKNSLKEETMSENMIEEAIKTKMYTYKELKGFYESTGERKDRIYLFEDGTYNYEENQDAAYGYFGNYIIDGKEIVLNQLFSHGSDIGVEIDEKQIKGTINEDSSITLKDKEKFNKKSSSVNGNYDTLSESVKRYIQYLEKENEKLYK